MADINEKFEISVNEKGLVITGTASGDRKSLSFTAAESLMLLDILRNEEENLKQMAQKDSPLPFRVNITSSTDET